MMRHRKVLVLVAALALATPAPAADLRVRGMLDLTLPSGTEALEWNNTTQGDSNFDPYRVRVFLDAAISPTLAFYGETILHEGAMGIRAEGAYAQWTPWPERDLHVQAGKVPWPIGTWGPRAYSDKNPLVGMPLMYQYHTSLAWDVPVASVDQLVAAAGQGQSGVQYGPYVGAGMPVVDDRWWDVGAVALGAQRPFEFALGVLQGSPGWPVNGRDQTPGQTTLGRFGIMPTAGVRMGVSGAWGTWMPEWFEYALPQGTPLRHYHEGLAMADVELSRGPWELRGEGFTKEWETYGAGTLHLHGGYGEARLALGNAWLAGRAEAIRFGDVVTSSSVTRSWDDGVDRIEIGAGYRVSRDVRLKLTAQRDVRHPFGAPADHADLVAAAASIRF